MPVSKKRIQNRPASTMQEQKVPAALRDWVHMWHGVRVKYGHRDCRQDKRKADDECAEDDVETSIFHAGSRLEEMPFWKQFIRLPSNSLFPRVDTLSNPRRPYKDFLYVLLNMRWPMLLMVLFGIFLVNIFGFALVSWIGCGEPTSFLESFDLSYQTFTTIGFGIVYPKKTCANIVMSVESFSSMMITSAITGLVFAKFAKPRAKVAFSKVCVVQPYGQKYLALVVRVANATQSRDVTHDVIMEASFKVNLLRVEDKADQVRDHERSTSTSSVNIDNRSVPMGNPGAKRWGQPTRPRLFAAATTTTIDSGNIYENMDEMESQANNQRQQEAEEEFAANKVLSSYNLKLLQNNFITFRMGIAVVHVIDEQSPLYGMSERDLARSDMIIEVAMSGVDSTLQDTVTERYVYTSASVKWGYRFAELLDFNELDAEVIMDFAKLSTIVPASIDAGQYLRRRVHSHRQHQHHQNHSLSHSGSSNHLSRHHHHWHPDALQESGSGSSDDSTTDTSSSDASLHHTAGAALSPVYESPHHPIEVPQEFSEQLIRTFSDSLNTPAAASSTQQSQQQQQQQRTERPATKTTTAKRRSLPVPSKSCMAMEPLFEPLLRPSYGTQRISAARKDSAQQQQQQQPNTDGYYEFDLEQGNNAGPSMVRNFAGLRPQNARAAMSNTTMAPERVVPARQKQQLQSQLAGNIISDEEVEDEYTDDGGSTISDVEHGEGTVEDDDESVGSGSNGSDSDSDVDDDNGVGQDRLRTSVASIDVEDTPRFLTIAPIHIPKSYGFMRLYHSALYQRWPRITLAFVLAFLVLNGVFGLLYWFQMDGLVAYSDITVSNYEQAFFMSVHTLATIGYGSIAPVASSVYMNIVVFIESMVGIIAVTIITGIAWSKFARPRAHIHFSSKIVLTSIYGHRCLVFRAANTRHSGEVHENFFRIGVILTNRKTGLRQMYDVPLVTAEWPSIKLPATLIHIIDETSPFYRFRTLDDLLESRVAVIALLTALDTTFSENVYARKMYFWDDFACDVRFADFAVIERDRVVVDYEHFDQLIPDVGGGFIGDATNVAAPMTDVV